MQILDAAIVGGGPGGLSAALGLARCMRRIALFDDGVARNSVARAIHGFLTRDGVTPRELRRVADAELRRYGVRVLREHVDDVVALERAPTLFEVRAQRRVLRARKLVLATGLVDILPDVDGFGACYGKSIWHCPTATATRRAAAASACSPAARRGSIWRAPWACSATTSCCLRTASRSRRASRPARAVIPCRGARSAWFASSTTAGACARWCCRTARASRATACSSTWARDSAPTCQSGSAA
jgi:hypothetical protein